VVLTCRRPLRHVSEVGGVSGSPPALFGSPHARTLRGVRYRRYHHDRGDLPPRTRHEASATGWEHDREAAPGRAACRLGDFPLPTVACGIGPRIPSKSTYFFKYLCSPPLFRRSPHRSMDCCGRAHERSSSWLFSSGTMPARTFISFIPFHRQ
jgi:hypothetical protein